jgi:transcriptional regulator GlxA family with amidase domain
MVHVTVVLVEGGLPSTAITPAEIFSSAGTLWAQITSGNPRPFFKVTTASIDGRSVRTPVSLALQPDCAIRAVRNTQLIIVPAISADLEGACARNKALLPWLRRWHERGAAIAGICSGVALLAEAGLLDGRPATTHWGLVDACRRRYPGVNWQPDRIITEAARVFCSGGVYASADLSLHLVEKHCGHKVAMQTARVLLLHTPRTWQPNYATEPPCALHADRQVQHAQEWLFRHFGEHVQIEELARRVGMSPRSFARRFRAASGMTPIAYLHQLRINAARHLLEGEGASLQEVSRDVGYEDVTFFRRLFKRYTGEPPRAYRDRFRPRRGTGLPG